MGVQQTYELPKLVPGKPIKDATVWTGADYPDDRSWVFALDSEMRGEIDRCMRIAMARGIAPKDITPEDFPLERTAAVLSEVYRGVECGPGFAMLSGFPVDGYSEDEITLFNSVGVAVEDVATADLVYRKATEGRQAAEPCA